MTNFLRGLAFSLFLLFPSSGLPFGLVADQSSVELTSLRTILGIDHSVSTPCNSGYARIGLWCMDTDGDPDQLRVAATTDEASYTTTVFESNARFVIMRLITIGTQDGTADTFDLRSCVIPGDSGITACGAQTEVGSGRVLVTLADQQDSHVTDILVEANGSGEVQTRCDANNAALVTSFSCSWFKIGYID